LRPANLLDSFSPGNVDDQYWHVDQLSQGNGAVCRLTFYQHRSRGRVVARRGVAGGEQALGEPGDAVGVLRMQHDHRTFAAGDRQGIQNLAVAEFQGVVGHIDLERGITLSDQRR